MIFVLTCGLIQKLNFKTIVWWHGSAWTEVISTYLVEELILHGSRRLTLEAAVFQ